MKSNKPMGTSPELILAKLLKKRIVMSSLPGKPDFVYKRSNLVIFVNGCWWHRCPIHALSLPKRNTEFWKRKFDRNVERDRINRLELEAKGWQVMEVWEHELREDPMQVANRIRRKVESSRV
jgi:DNA mismatch endonuclease (patch repair protein)